MSEDRRDVLQVLRYELNYVEQGGYGRSVGSGKAVSPFKDTLSCLNFGEPHRPHACHECLLFDFVPEASRTEDVPCHFIPLNSEGRTIAEIKKSGSPEELENAVKNWLQTTISHLEHKAEPAVQSSGS